MKIKYLDDKFILMLGLGLTTYESALALEEYKKNIIIVDSNLEKNSYRDKLTDKEYVVMSEEEFLKEEFKINLILKSPGVQFDNKSLVKYHGIPVINDIELAYLYIKENQLNTKIVAVTATNGKTSTTLFLESVLCHAGLNAKSAGNIGISPLSVLKEEPLDYLVLEVSSFQLMNINEFKPDYSFILNITPNHLNMHPTFEHYVEAKKHVFKNQNEGDFLFAKQKVYDKFLKGLDIKPEVVINNVNHEIVENIEFYDHQGINFNNLLLCYKFCEVVGIESKYYFKALNKFEGLEHRVEFVQCINGVNFYNDSKGTTLEATKESLKHLESIILLVGGVSKGQDMSRLDIYLDSVKFVICYGENKNEFVSDKIIARVENLEDAVSQAKLIAKKGDNILLSPASASLDQYKNYKVRGKHFKRLIKEKW